MRNAIHHDRHCYTQPHPHSQQLLTLIDQIALLVSVSLSAPEQNIEFAKFRDDTVHFALILLLERHVVVIGASLYQQTTSILLAIVVVVLAGSFRLALPAQRYR